MASPLLWLRAPGRDPRVCIDYQQVNRCTTIDYEPLPHIEHVLYRLAGFLFYSSFDLKSGYWQILVHEADRWKTAFVCKGMLFRPQDCALFL